MGDNSAHKHWYELNPSRLEMEKMAMAALFPEFELNILDDGNLYWRGILTSDKLINSYTVNIDYPNWDTVSNITPKLLLISPDARECRENLGDEIFATLFDDYGRPIIYSNESPKSIETAASILKKSIDWFASYESEKRKIPQTDVAARRRYLLRRMKLLEINFLVSTISFKVFNYSNNFAWWHNSESYEKAISAISRTFPQFSFEVKKENTTHPHYFRDSGFISIEEQILIIKGTLSPNIYCHQEYNIQLTYKLWSTEIQFDDTSSVNLLRQLRLLLKYRPNLHIIDDTWFNRSPVELILWVLNWIVDVELLLTKFKTIPEFELKYGEGIDYTEIYNTTS